MRLHIVTALFCLLCHNLSAQNFVAKDSIAVYENNILLKNAFAGGLNNCIFGEIDLNLDGIQDLVVYDNSANKLLTFIYLQNQGYVLDEKYADKFPEFSSWFCLKDFNNDGKNDLFIFNGLGGIRLYKNVSETELAFQLYVPNLKAKLFDNYQTLFCSSVDYPAIVDVDGDGDLDILTFWVPSYQNSLFYYKNHSVEKYGHADSLDFIIENRAWGCFMESESDNNIILDTCNVPQNAALRHTGSTVFASDLNNDGTKDILLGDFGYPNIVALLNGGSQTDAYITSFDDNFPHNYPVNILNSPLVSEIDFDKDGNKDLIFSPFFQGNFSTQGDDCVWLYKNDGGQAVNYQLVTKNFLQNTMLDLGLAAYPEIVDINHDGKNDILIGNYAVVDSSYFENGEWKPYYSSQLRVLLAQNDNFHLENISLADMPFGNFRALNSACADIDNDGLLDLIIGTENGKLLRFRQDENNFLNFIFNEEMTFEGFSGEFLSPTFFDLNNDGLLDLIVGERQSFWSAQNYKGNLNYFENIGTINNPLFSFITDSLGRVDVIDHDVSVFGYSNPAFFRDSMEEVHLFCGNIDGSIQHYLCGSGDVSNNVFERLNDVRYSTTLGNRPVYEGRFSAPAIGDFNGDNLPDMVVGNYRGGIRIFYGIEENDDAVLPKITQNFIIYPNPATSELRITNYNLRNGETIEIYDINGKLHLTSHNNQQSTINIITLPNGIYILKIGNNTAKFIKE